MCILFLNECVSLFSPTGGVGDGDGNGGGTEGGGGGGA